MKDARIRADGTAIGRGRETDKDLDGLVELAAEDVLGASSGRVPVRLLLAQLHVGPSATPHRPPPSCRAAGSRADRGRSLLPSPSQLVEPRWSYACRRVGETIQGDGEWGFQFLLGLRAAGTSRRDHVDGDVGVGPTEASSCPTVENDFELGEARRPDVRRRTRPDVRVILFDEQESIAPASLMHGLSPVRSHPTLRCHFRRAPA